MVEINPYLALAINGFFTGMGVIVAQHTYEIYFKNKINFIHNKVNSLTDRFNKQKGIKEKD